MKELKKERRKERKKKRRGRPKCCEFERALSKHASYCVLCCAVLGSLAGKLGEVWLVD